MLKNFLIKLWDVFPFLHGVIALQLNYTPKTPKPRVWVFDGRHAYFVLFYKAKDYGK